MQTARGKALTTGRAGAQGPTPRRVGLLLAVACAVYITDVVSKAIVVATLSPRHPIRLLGGLVKLHLLRNSGAAFSVGTSLTIAFTLIAVGVIIFILRTSRRLRSVPWAVVLGLLLGGATGNLTDRLLRSPGVFRGQVVDWIQVPHWPVFNVADSAIVCGGVLAVLLAARGMRLDGTREDPVPARRPGADARSASPAGGDGPSSSLRSSDPSASDARGSDDAAPGKDQAAGDSQA